MPAIEDLLAEWLRRVKQSNAFHRDAERYYGRLNNRLGVAVVALSTLIGAFLFFTLEWELGYWARVAILAAGMLAAVLALLQTFLKYGERMERHRLAGAAFAAISRSMELTQAGIQKGQPLSEAQLEEFRAAMDQASREAPALCARVRRPARGSARTHREAA